MKISELVLQLEELKEKWGDVEVRDKLTYSKPWLTVNKLTSGKDVIAIN